MRAISVCGVCLVLLLALSGHALAQQITSTGTNYASSTMKVSPIDQEHWVAAVDQMGIRLDDTGKGPFHLLSTHVAVIMYGDKAGVQFHGYLTQMDKDNDKIIWEIWGTTPAGNKGKAKIIGATGKFSGMEGTGDFETTTPAGFPQGTGRMICKEILKVTLKAPL